MLVNNAGITRDGLLMRMSESGFLDDVMNITCAIPQDSFATPVFVLTLPVSLSYRECRSSKLRRKIIGLTKSACQGNGSRGLQ